MANKKKQKAKKTTRAHARPFGRGGRKAGARRPKVMVGTEEAEARELTGEDITGGPVAAEEGVTQSDLEKKEAEQ